MIDWLKSKGVELAGKGVITTANGIGALLVSMEGIFVIIAIIGVYFIVFGEKKWGTRLTSLSILLYLLGRVLQVC